MTFKLSEQSLYYLNKDSKLIANVQHLGELPLVVAKAKGPYLYDPDGRKILDFISGACTFNLGYNYELDEELLNSGSFPFPYAVGTCQLDYAEALLEHYRFNEDKRLAFGVIGSDSIDACIKYCRAYTHKTQIVSFLGDYHGTTYGSGSLTSMPGRLSGHFGPMLPECLALPFCPDGADDATLEHCLNAFLSLDLSKVAGVIIEAVQGDTGMLPMHPKFLSTLYEISRKEGFLLVSDEVQLASYRTGPFFCIENFHGIKPDLVAMGKNLGGGVPLGCVMGRAEVMNSLKPLEHAFTFAGNAEACRRGLNNLRTIEKLHATGQIERLASSLEEGLVSLKEKHPCVSAITGLKLARGLWIKSPHPELSDNEACYQILWDCFEKGLYSQRLGINFVRIEPQLNLKLDELKFALEVLDSALSAMEEGRVNLLYQNYYLK